MDWSTFVIEDEDDQLIDLECFFGEPFPVLGAADGGQEEVDAAGDSAGPDIIGGGNGKADAGDLCDGLVRVVVKEHEGKRKDEPFRVINKQMVCILLVFDNDLLSFCSLFLLSLGQDKGFSTFLDLFVDLFVD